MRPGLKQAASQLRVEAGTVQSLGYGTDLVIGYLDQDRKEYRTTSIPSSFEIGSGVGNVSVKEGKPFVHLHVVATGPDGGRRRRTSDGGHEGISDRGLPPAARRAGPGPRAGRRHRARGVALRGARGVEMSETKELHLKPGDPAPDFELLDQNGNTVKLSDYRGQKLLIYFYPKADTPGCT